MTGGVARNAAAVEYLSRTLDAEVTVPEYPQITGAYGAALLALDGADRGSVPAARGAGETTTDAREPARSCSTCEVAETMNAKPLYQVGGLT
jgi:sugar (pentulose or hexulose) kinase